MDLLGNVQLTTTTGKAGIPLSFKALLTIKAALCVLYVWRGRVHDARVFANSSLHQKGQSGNLLPDWKEEIDEKDVMLGYPLLP